MDFAKSLTECLVEYWDELLIKATIEYTKLDEELTDQNNKM